MAQYRFEVHWPSGRKEGSSGAVAKAAYVNREQYYDLNNGKSTNDYSKKHEEELLWSAVFVDKAFEPPEWVNHPEKLWNEAAGAEKRRDALECQDAIINLPHELTLDQNKRWITDFIRENLTRGTGRVVNVAFHAPSEKSDERNTHAHLLWSLREICPDGFGKRLPPLNRSDIEHLREKCAERGSRELRRADFEVEADRWAAGHLTLEKQRESAMRRGDNEYAKTLDREPHKHMGPKATAMEREGVKTRKGARNAEIEARNQERKQDWDRENVADLQKAMTTQQKRSLEEKVRGDGEHVYWAFRNAETPEAFAEDIKQRRLHLVRITKEDAEHSKTLNFLQEKFNGKYHPIFREGEYLVVNNKGWAYRLTMRSVEFTSAEVGRFMAPLNGNDVPSLRTVLRAVEARRIAGIDPRPYGSLPSDKLKRGARTAVRDTSRLASHGMRTGTRVLGKSLDAVTGLLESFLSPVLTPEQKWDARIVNEERRERAEEATRRSRDDGGRDR